MQAPELRNSLRRLDQIAAYLEREPNNPHLLAEMLDLLLAVGELQQARKCAQQAVAAHPAHAGLLSRFVLVCITESQFDEAESLISTLATLAGGQDAAIYNLAHVRFMQGRHDDAVHCLIGASHLLQSLPAARALLLKALHQSGQAQAAFDTGKSYLNSGIGTPELAGICALLAFDLEQFDAAEALADAALSAVPAEANALVAKASLALLNEECALASTLFEQVLAQGGRDGRSWVGLAVCALHHNDVAAAREHFAQATQIMPAHLGSRVALAWCSLANSDLDLAEQEFNTAMELDRNFGETHGGLAVIAALRGQMELARQRAERALRLDPGCASARFAQAIVSGELHDAGTLNAFVVGLLKQQRNGGKPHHAAEQHAT